jgi:hypothetical protein
MSQLFADSGRIYIFGGDADFTSVPTAECLELDCEARSELRDCEPRVRLSVAASFPSSFGRSSSCLAASTPATPTTTGISTSATLC